MISVWNISSFKWLCLDVSPSHLFILFWYQVWWLNWLFCSPPAPTVALTQESRCHSIQLFFISSRIYIHSHNFPFCLISVHGFKSYATDCRESLLPSLAILQLSWSSSQTKFDPSVTSCLCLPLYFCQRSFWLGVWVVDFFHLWIQVLPFSFPC